MQQVEKQETKICIHCRIMDKIWFLISIYNRVTIKSMVEDQAHKNHIKIIPTVKEMPNSSLEGMKIFNRTDKMPQLKEAWICPQIKLDHSSRMVNLYSNSIREAIWTQLHLCIRVQIKWFKEAWIKTTTQRQTLDRKVQSLKGINFKITKGKIIKISLINLVMKQILRIDW